MVKVTNCVVLFDGVDDSILINPCAVNLSISRHTLNHDSWFADSPVELQRDGKMEEQKIRSVI